MRLLRRASGYTEQTPKRALDEMKLVVLSQKLQLCYLQLCQAIPLIINEILFAIYVNTNFPDFITFEIAYWMQYMLFFVNFFDCLAHSFHFFLYIALSASFRDGFRKRFLDRYKASAGEDIFVKNFALGWLEKGGRIGEGRRVRAKSLWRGCRILLDKCMEIYEKNFSGFL